MQEAAPISVITFYKFFPIDERRLASLKDRLKSEGENLNIKGLIVLASEGCNSTIAGTRKSIDAYKDFLHNKLEVEDLVFKESYSEDNPFRRFKIDIRKEIVTLGKHCPLPEMDTKWHLNPEEWHEMLTDKARDFVLLDVRNHYETLLGKFKGAEAPAFNSFGEFPEYIDRAGIPKDKKVLMYCTGGIRCEKAAYEMKQKGYENVYQLQGGILKYLEEFPDQEYEGECFVFDDRVAVDQSLEPSKRYSLCPHCGDPACVPIECITCETRAVICDRCARVEAYRTCSKNCRYHFENRLALN